MSLETRITDPDTCAAVRSLVSTYKSSNRKEQRRLTENQIARLIRKSISASEMSDADLTKLVEHLLRPYDGPPVQTKTSPTARDLQREDRKKTVKNLSRYRR